MKTITKLKIVQCGIVRTSTGWISRQYGVTMATGLGQYQARMKPHAQHVYRLKESAK